jgi:hypothetical protein
MKKQEEQPGLDRVGTLHASGVRHSVILLCEVRRCVYVRGPAQRLSPMIRDLDEPKRPTGSEGGAALKAALHGYRTGP